MSSFSNSSIYISPDLARKIISIDHAFILADAFDDANLPEWASYLRDWGTVPNFLKTQALSILYDKDVNLAISLNYKNLRSFLLTKLADSFFIDYFLTKCSEAQTILVHCLQFPENRDSLIGISCCHSISNYYYYADYRQRKKLIQTALEYKKLCYLFSMTEAYKVWSKTITYLKYYPYTTYLNKSICKPSKK